jgi:hypothetical protein
MVILKYIYELFIENDHERQNFYMMKLNITLDIRLS